MVKESHNKLLVFLIYVTLAVATIIAFEPVRHNDFVEYDDNLYVTENWHVQEGITPKSVVWAFTTLHAAFWHPLTQLSHMLDCQLFGLKPLGHHATSLLLHIANTLLLFWVLKSMTGAVWPSGFVAVAFALHPLHVESVVWVAERKDVLSSLFWMLTMAAYIRYVKQPGVIRYLLVIVFFCLGMMAKPMLVTLPFVLLLLDYWPLGRLRWTRQSKGETLPQSESAGIGSFRTSALRLVAEKIPLFVLVAVLSVTAFVAQQSRGSLARIENLPLSLRAANALVSYISYISKMIYPVRLAALYPYPIHGLPLRQPLISLLILGVISAAVIYAARQRRYLAVGWLWYLGTLVPVIGLIQVGPYAMADRFTYLPSIGIFIMVGWCVAEVSAKWRYQKILLGTTAGIVLAALLICTRMQVRHWQNSFTLFKHAVEVTKNNYVMHNNLGKTLGSQHKLEEAISHFHQALQINPNHAKAYHNLGTVFGLQGKLDQAIAHFTKALRIDPDFADAHSNLGFILTQQGKFDQAIKHYSEALRLEPEHVQTINNFAITLREQGRINEAIEKWKKALELRPNHPDANYNMGRAMARQGKYGEAIKHFNEALQAKPDWPELYNGLGLAYAQLGKHELAIQNYNEALQLKPDYSEALNNCGVALKNQGKLDEAIRKWEKALKIKPDSPDPHFNMGMAMARKGRYNDAVKHFNEALRAKSDWPMAYYSLGRVYQLQGNLEPAVSSYYKFLELKPDHVEALNRLAWILATTEDVEIKNATDAIKFAQRACEFTNYKQPGTLNTLAVAYAAADRVSEAIATAEKALKLAQSLGQNGLAEKIKKHLELYKSGQPYQKLP